VENTWAAEFHDRMTGFEKARRMHPGDASVSIKVRIASGYLSRLLRYSLVFL
jgi:hypothetical protein